MLLNVSEAVQVPTTIDGDSVWRFGRVSQADNGSGKLGAVLQE